MLSSSSLWPSSLEQHLGQGRFWVFDEWVSEWINEWTSNISPPLCYIANKIVNTLATLPLSGFCHWGICLCKSKRERVYGPRSEGYPGGWCDYTCCAQAVPVYTCCLSIKFNSVPFPCVSVLAGIVNYLAAYREDKQLLLTPDRKWQPQPKASRAHPLALPCQCAPPNCQLSICSCDSREFFGSHRKLPWPCTPGWSWQGINVPQEQPSSLGRRGLCVMARDSHPSGRTEADVCSAPFPRIPHKIMLWLTTVVTAYYDTLVGLPLPLSLPHFLGSGQCFPHLLDELLALEFLLQGLLLGEPKPGHSAPYFLPGIWGALLVLNSLALLSRHPILRQSLPP